MTPDTDSAQVDWPWDTDVFCDLCSREVDDVEFCDNCGFGLCRSCWGPRCIDDLYVGWCHNCAG